MTEPHDEELVVTLHRARQRFLDLVADVRPELHRYCARMTGSVFDGEDVVQTRSPRRTSRSRSSGHHRRSGPGCFASLTTRRSTSCGGQRRG